MMDDGCQIGDCRVAFATENFQANLHGTLVHETLFLSTKGRIFKKFPGLLLAN